MTSSRTGQTRCCYATFTLAGPSALRRERAQSRRSAAFVSTCLTLVLTGNRAFCRTLLTGRNEWRDCVHGVWSCFDPTDACNSNFNNGGSKKFAPKRTFTVADAIHAADRQNPNLGYNDGTFIAGKVRTFASSEIHRVRLPHNLLNSIAQWHLGPLLNGSSPLDHGFDHMFVTQEVAPTSTTNCMCGDGVWEEQCHFGHNNPWACANVTHNLHILSFFVDVTLFC